MSKQIAVVYFSGYGHTQRMAQAVAEGAQATLIAIDQEGELPPGAWDSLAGADAIIFGSPTYMGNAAWQFKRFADASSKVWFTQGWKDKVAGGFTNSASLYGDKQNTLNGLFTLAMQHGMIWVGNGQMPANGKANTRADANNLGSSAGAMAATPHDAGVDEMSEGDLETARRFGARVAATVARLQAQV